MKRLFLYSKSVFFIILYKYLRHTSSIGPNLDHDGFHLCIFEGTLPLIPDTVNSYMLIMSQTYYSKSELYLNLILFFIYLIWTSIISEGGPAPPVQWSAPPRSCDPTWTNGSPVFDDPAVSTDSWTGQRARLDKSPEDKEDSQSVLTLQQIISQFSSLLSHNITWQ